MASMFLDIWGRKSINFCNNLMRKIKVLSDYAVNTNII